MAPQKIHENDNIVVPMFSNYKGRCSNYQKCECLNLSTVYCEVAVDVANQNKVVKLKVKKKRVWDHQ